MNFKFRKVCLFLFGCGLSSLQAITPEAQMNQELLKLDQELSQRYLRRAFADMEPSKNWADLTFSYAPGVNNFPADASIYFSGPKLGYFAGVQVYNLQVANLQGTEYSYYSNAVGATLMQGLHYQVAPQWHFMGGFLLSSARMQYKTDDEVRVVNTPTSALLSRGFAPFFQYQHPWSDSVKTQADIALNPSDPASVAQWGLKLLLELAGFEVNGEFDDVKTLGGRQIMAGIQGIKRYEGTEYSDGKLKNKVSVRLGTITRTRDETVALPIALQPVQSGFYATGEVWHNWLIGGLSFVEAVGPGARLGVGTETDKATYVVTAQYKYLMTDIYGARVDTFSLYFSVLAKNLF